MAHTKEELLYSLMVQFGRQLRRNDFTCHKNESGPAGMADSAGQADPASHTDSSGQAASTDPATPANPRKSGHHVHHGHHGRHHHHSHVILSRERILIVLLHYKEGLRQKALTEYMGVNASSMSEFISRLEDGGYIKRCVDPSDKRATLITLTEKGKARAWELQDERKERLDYIFRNLTEEEKTELLRLLRKVVTPSFEEMFPPEKSKIV